MNTHTIDPLEYARRCKGGSDTPAQGPSRVVVRFAVGAALVLSVGCEGASSSRGPANNQDSAIEDVDNAAALGSVRTVYFPDQADGSPVVAGVNKRLRGLLLGAGFSLVGFPSSSSGTIESGDATNEQSRAPDFAARVNVLMTEKPSFMTTYINGRRQVTYEVSVAVVISDAHGNLITEPSVKFESSGDDIDEEALDQLVRRLSRSPTLEVAVRRVVRAREDRLAAARAERRRTTEAASAEERIKNAEFDSAIVQCREPTDASSCDSLRGLVSTDPHNSQAHEARAVLHESEPVVADMALWARATPNNCRDAAADRDCDGVRAYLERYPMGIYEDEARAALEAGDKRVSASKARAQTQNRQSACRSKCAAECSSAAAAEKGRCVSACVQLSCP